ncbi:L-threonylcarbamoyladenylate synthase [Inmirania thermothiophila]|uniref:Threonylcarbamoyl-AMP synthase n=1 Tax=Inmirania thermothiophila TaxID=1750597 RepID=A0A3N1Y142_9GAMM|nr:L-threonylcarbamoyladenylate synthase [Inmirania thermothiophila]ROR32510.1 translation factor SUA5 [Inmirania thermothiophila]
MVRILPGGDERALREAAGLLRRGGLVAFPTETVYGLGALARDPAAVARVFAAKGRPADHPLIVHLAEAGWMGRWARTVPEPAWRLAERFWPGPLTLVLPRAEGVPDAVTGGQDTVGLRVPAHRIARRLVAAVGDGVAAPSANRFGRISPTRAEDVAAELGEAVDAIVDGGPCAVGVESTILDVSGARPRLLRPGGIPAEALAEVLGEMPAPAGAAAPRSPGRLAAHYAPRTPLELVPGAELAARAAALAARGARVAVLTHGAERPAAAAVVERMPAQAEGYARALYARLRGLDAGGFDRILVAEPPRGGLWEAVADRLRRAAAGSGAEEEERT